MKRIDFFTLQFARDRNKANFRFVSLEDYLYSVHEIHTELSENPLTFDDYMDDDIHLPQKECA